MRSCMWTRVVGCTSAGVSRGEASCFVVARVASGVSTWRPVYRRVPSTSALSATANSQTSRLKSYLWARGIGCGAKARVCGLWVAYGRWRALMPCRWRCGDRANDSAPGSPRGSPGRPKGSRAARRCAAALSEGTIDLCRNQASIEDMRSVVRRAACACG